MRVALPEPSLSCAPRVLPSWRVLSYARQTPQHHPRARGALRQVAGGQQQGEDEHAATSRPPPPVLPVKEELSGSAELQDAGEEEQAEEGGGDAVAAAGELQDGEEIAPHVQDEPASSLGASQVPPTQEYEELLSAPASELPTQNYEEAALEDASQAAPQQPALLQSAAGDAAEKDAGRSERSVCANNGLEGAEREVAAGKKRKRLQQAESSDDEESGEGATAEDGRGATAAAGSGEDAARQEEEEVDNTDWRERTKACPICAIFSSLRVGMCACGRRFVQHVCVLTRVRVSLSTRTRTRNFARAPGLFFRRMPINSLAYASLCARAPGLCAAHADQTCSGSTWPRNDQKSTLCKVKKHVGPRS